MKISLKIKHVLATFALVVAVGIAAVAAKPVDAKAYCAGAGYGNYAGLAGLIAVDNLTVTPGDATNDLGSLIVLNGLFNNPYGYGSGGYGYGGLAGLAGLVAVDNITTPGPGGSTTGYNNDLASLIVLNGLFNNPY